jgi:3-oxoacyl-[acyl-carrier protein] reductase
MKHVIVTGASQGLGLAFANTLLDAGYAVSICSRSRSAAIDALLANYSHVMWESVDVSDADAVDAFVQHAVAHFANMDADIQLWGLINNAGVATEGILATFPHVESDRMIDVNLNGSLYMARAFLRQLYRSPHGGRIINISSIIGSRGYTGLAAYSASKAGLEGLTRALARENGRREITVNAIAPGYLETEMSSSLNEKKREQIVRRTPLQRLGTTADITPMALFLLSDEAAFITGQTITIDGGITN